MVKITGNTFPVKEQLKALGGRWNAAAKCWEVPDDKAEQARALVAPTPLYNSPPPQDLGTADPVALAATFGRVAVALAKVRSFTGYGKEPIADGTVHHLAKSARRYLQVAHGRPRYYSRDMLEDFDMFGDEPGYQYQWDGVEVEPSEAERAEDDLKARAKAEAARLAAEAKARAEAEQAERWAAWEATIAGLEECTAEPLGATDEGTTLVIREVRDVRITGHKVTLADGRTGWRKRQIAGDDWRTYHYLPADAAAAARLARAAERGITPEEAADWLNKYAGCHGEDLYRAIVTADDETRVALRDAAERKRERDLIERREAEHGRLRRDAEVELIKAGLIDLPADFGWTPSRIQVAPCKATSWELRIGPEFEPYVAAAARSGYDLPRREGATIVLRLPAEAFEVKPRSRKPAPGEQLPGELVIDARCTAKLVIERA